MADICTASHSPGSCGHFNVTATVAGVSVTASVLESELALPLNDDDRRALLVLNARVLRQTGLPLSQFVGRVIRGDEATNVKQYDIIAAGSAITKTNIGTAYVNILPGANGCRSLVDFTGAVEFRLILTANLVAVGPFGVRVVRDNDNAVLFENASIALTGEQELDTNWQPIPAWNDLILLRIQAKSITAADDPVFRRCVILVR